VSKDTTDASASRPGGPPAKPEIMFGMEIPETVLYVVKQLALKERITATAWWADAAAEKLKTAGFPEVAAALADTGRKPRGRPRRGGVAS
jgi:hypothetical protein